MLALALVPLITFAADPDRITGREAEAIALATRTFKSKQGSRDQEGHPVYGDLRHYTVQLERHGRQVDVVFVPQWAPTEQPHPGGSSDYGWEIHYVISLDRMKILKEEYAR